MDHSLHLLHLNLQQPINADRWCSYSTVMVLKRNFSSPFTHPIWLDFYSQPSADFKMLISLKCHYVLREKASCYIHASHHIQETQHHLERKKKRTQSSEFLFLFRKVDENAPNVSQIIAFLVSWSVNIAYSRSSFSDAHKLVRDEVFIKSYIPPDTQYSSTPTKSNPLTRRKSTQMVLRSAPSRITIGEQLQVSHSASRNI